MSANDGGPRFPRQAVSRAAAVVGIVAEASEESGRKSRVRASIFTGCKKINLIATNLQLHLILASYPAGSAILLAQSAMTSARARV
jgi:hypothetical protein